MSGGGRRRAFFFFLSFTVPPSSENGKQAFPLPLIPGGLILLLPPSLARCPFSLSQLVVGWWWAKVLFPLRSRRQQTQGQPQPRFSTFFFLHTQEEKNIFHSPLEALSRAKLQKHFPPLLPWPTCPHNFRSSLDFLL